ncbi:hypothetical protein OEG92_02525 [Polaribacter sejongensis]|uniref:hypothetical protein n=1 Tax=Polaribacter sejongensis TaxID=985043 RepID=UPI0035A5B40A
MNKIKIDYTNNGGYNQVSNYLIQKHGANFALIIDAIVNIYNMNIDKLNHENGITSVKISNGFLSRNTGLSEDIIKRNVKKIEDIGLITAIKKGRGNIRHYVIHSNHINSYLQSLKVGFEEWYTKSQAASKKDKARSKEADLKKMEESNNNFNKTMKELGITNMKTTNELVQNPPTKKIKTNIVKELKIPVEDIKHKTIKRKRQQQREKSVVVDIFIKSDNNGTYILIDKYEKKVYKAEYEDYINKYTTKELEEKLEEFKSKEEIIDSGEDDSWLENLEEALDNSKPALKIEKPNEKAQTPTIVQPPIISNEELMIYTYEIIQDKTQSTINRTEREYKKTKEPAKKAVSEENWSFLKNAYDNLPNIPSQGQFYVNKSDKENFFYYQNINKILL